MLRKAQPFDFVEVHYYPEYNKDSDQELLGPAIDNFAGDLTGLRAQMNAAHVAKSVPIYLGEFNNDACRRRQAIGLDRQRAVPGADARHAAAGGRTDGNLVGRIRKLRRERRLFEEALRLAGLRQRSALLGRPAQPVRGLRQYAEDPRWNAVSNRTRDGTLCKRGSRRVERAPRQRIDVLKVPLSVTSLGPALAAAAALVRTAEEEAKAVTEGLDEPERDSLRRAFGEGSSGKGVAKAMRGMAGAMKDLEDRQKSRATRVKRDTLDQALLELAQFYRDVLMVQLDASVERANEDASLRQVASASSPEATLRRMQAIMRCRERLTLNVAPLLAVEEMTLSLVRG